MNPPPDVVPGLAPVDVLPPPDPVKVQKLASLGVILSAIAAVVGVIDFLEIDQSSPLRYLHTLRLLLFAGAGLLAAHTLVLRPGDWRLWACATGVGLLGWIGVPAHWDSGRLVVHVLTVLAGVGLLITTTSPKMGCIIVSVWVLFHYGNMVTATTSPTPTPWITTQVMHRVYSPYMRFMYLGNAYHFYSPEPGPSSHLYCLITWELEKPAVDEKGQPKFNKDGTPQRTESAWVDVPNRSLHYKDPLGLAYYRRLSITELVSGSSPSTLSLATFEKNVAFERRKAAAVSMTNPIPLTSEQLPIETQYRIPRSDIQRYLLPSYMRHVAHYYTTPGRKVISIRLYRVEHTVLTKENYMTEVDGEFISPYSPFTYRPFYLGKYDSDGNLMDPQDPMLYWLVPILQKRSDNGIPIPGQIDDCLSRHAGHVFEWRKP